MCMSMASELALVGDWRSQFSQVTDPPGRTVSRASRPSRCASIRECVSRWCSLQLARRIGCEQARSSTRSGGTTMRWRRSRRNLTTDVGASLLVERDGQRVPFGRWPKANPVLGHCEMQINGLDFSISPAPRFGINVAADGPTSCGKTDSTRRSAVSMGARLSRPQQKLRLVPFLWGPLDGTICTSHKGTPCRAPGRFLRAHRPRLSR